jgi:3-hydroxy-9,10-secoandrosta-1,3,5(10)-triene-9,17-dione monooxygenase reductase component
LTTGLDQARFREVLGHFATGITIVSALEEGQPVGFSCQSFAALSLDPPMVVLAPARTSTSWPRIRAAGAFCVNILSEHQEAVCRAFAISGGNKFAGIGWRPGITGAPMIDGSLAVVECELGEIFEGGDHEIVTGLVVGLEVGESGGPLLFYRGGFGRFVS